MIWTTIDFSSETMELRIEYFLSAEKKDCWPNGMSHKKKNQLKTFVLWETLLREWKDKSHTKRKYLQITYPAKALYPKHIKELSKLNSKRKKTSLLQSHFTKEDGKKEHEKKPLGKYKWKWKLWWNTTTHL